MVARTPRLLEGGRGSTVFQTGTDILDSESEALVFFRLGWLNPGGLLPRGSLQSVAYVVQEGRSSVGTTLTPSRSLVPNRLKPY